MNSLLEIMTMNNEIILEVWNLRTLKLSYGQNRTDFHCKLYLFRSPYFR